MTIRLPITYKLHVCPECGQHHWWGSRGGHLPGCSQPNTAPIDAMDAAPIFRLAGFERDGDRWCEGGQPFHGGVEAAVTRALEILSAPSNRS